MTELKVVFTKSKKRFPIFSWLVMLWTGKPYSHVAREVVRRDWGSGFYQASEGKVHYEFESLFYKKHEVVKEYKLLVPKELEMEVRKACWHDCGKTYGMMQNVGIPLIDIGLLKNNPWKDGRNCSELIYLKVLKVLIPELDYNPDTIKPHHIEDIILEYFSQQGEYWILNG